MNILKKFSTPCGKIGVPEGNAKNLIIHLRKERSNHLPFISSRIFELISY
jgi:hypothetical protein